MARVQAINLRTGRPAKWPRWTPSTGTDHAEFNCVYRGAHYRLASFSRHSEKGVPPGSALIVDSRYRSQVVPLSEVHVSTRIL